MYDVFAQWPWWLFCIVIIFVSTAYGVFLRMLDADTHPSIFSFIFSSASGVFLGIVCFIFYLNGERFSIGAAGLLLAFATGTGFFMADKGTIAMFRAGAPIGLGVAAIRSSVAAMGAVIGVLVFKETPSLINILGVCCTTIGIFLLCYKRKRPQDDIIAVK